MALTGPVLIVGKGALGMGLAHLLGRAGVGVRAIGRDGATRLDFEMEDTLEAIHAPALTPRELISCPLAFIAVKAYDLREALLQHVPLFSKKTILIPIGNGAVESEIAAVASELPGRTWRLGVATLAVTRTSPTRISLRGTSPRISWGPLIPDGDSPRPAEEHLCSLLPHVFHWMDDPYPAYKKKWLFNTTLNTLVGVDRLKKNGSVLRHRHKLMMVFSESYALGEEHWGTWEEAPDKLFAEFLSLVEATAENKNSMGADVEQGNPTETDFLAGLARQTSGYPLLKELDQKLRNLLH